ncbi:MAG: SPOR domain-containing protein [Pseudolabrys sp.]
MADDGYRKPLRADDSFGRTTGASASSGANDPLAELARLIGQTDPFAEFGRNQRAADAPQERASEPHIPRAFTPFEQAEPAPQVADPYQQQQYGLPLAAQPNAPADYPPPVAAQRFHDGQGYDPGTFAPEQLQPGQDLYYDDVPPRRSRVSILAIAGVFALAVIGTAGALGYRALFGGSGSAPPPVIKADTAPSKVVPPATTAQTNKLINDRIGDKVQGERLVSREEAPVDLARQATPAAMAGGAASGSTTGSAVQSPPGGNNALYEPKKIKTIAIRPDQPGVPSAADAAATARTAAAVAPPQPAARPGNGPLSIAAIAEQNDDRPVARPAAQSQAPRVSSSAPLALTPGASAPQQPAPAVRTASAPAAAASNGNGSGYAVQVSSQRSEADAQASFRNMQGRFPGQLGGRQAIIRRADLGSKGVYYRAMVGPFASSGEATELCNSLKAAGGQCIVQKI